MVRLGVTLPSFVDDPEIPLAVALAADAAGLDAVFAYDHLFRDERGERRPALECFALLGAVAAETTTVGLGSLVARATLRPAAVLTHAFDTVQRVSGGRLLAAVGAGDSQSRAEMETFGLGFGTVTERLADLASAVRAARGRGYPVWVGGTARIVGPIAAREADGWNRWGGTPAQFAADLAAIREQVAADGGDPARFTATWGGLVLIGASDAEVAQKRARLEPNGRVIVGRPDQVAERLHGFVEAGASWLICGPLDSRDPANAALLHEVRDQLRREP